MRTSFVELPIPRFAGLNTAKTFSEIDTTQSPKMDNLIPRREGGLANRPGSAPITTTPIGAIKTLHSLRKDGTNIIVASSGTTLYKYASNALTAVTMTNALTSANIDAAQFKDENGQEVLVIADGGKLKEFNGTAVLEITPAPNDADPLPANDMTNIQTAKPPIGVLVHNTRVVIWGANSDTIHHSKIGYYDYFTQVDYQRFVRENDYIMTCVSYAGALLVLMRRHIGVLFGQDIDNWSQDFLDTTDGCVNGKSVQTVTYPDGRQEVFYQSDNGVHAIYTIDTLALDSSARYSTKKVSQDIDFDALGVTKTEWASATAHFYKGMYWLVYKKGSEWNGLVFNTDDAQWYPISGVPVNAFYHDEDYYYFAGDDGHLKVFDDDVEMDYTDYARTTGTDVTWERYSKLLSPKVTGYDHFWDILMVEARQFEKKSTINVEVNTYKNKRTQTGAIKTEIFIWGVSNWGEAEYANANMTDVVNNAKRLEVFVSGQYAQTRVYGTGPVELFFMTWELRMMER